MNTFLTYLLGLVGSLGGLTISYLAYMIWDLQLSHVNFVPAKATVVSSASSSIGFLYLKKSVDFQYDAPNGSRFDAHRQISSIYSIGRDFTAGQKMIVYINPANAKEVANDHGPTWQTYTLFVCGLLMTLIFGRIVIKYIRYFFFSNAKRA